jgi:formate transporter
MAEIFGMDAYTPGEIADRIEQIGVAKARLPLRAMFMLAVLGGAFIGFGALYSVVVRADHSLGMGIRLVMAGMSFSLGLLLVVVAGAELFTGNNLLVMAWADRRISSTELLRNWIVVLAGNAAGAGGLALQLLRLARAVVVTGKPGTERGRLQSAALGDVVCVDSCSACIASLSFLSRL